MHFTVIQLHFIYIKWKWYECQCTYFVYIIYLVIHNDKSQGVKTFEQNDDMYISTALQELQVILIFFQKSK